MQLKRTRKHASQFHQHLYANSFWCHSVSRTILDFNLPSLQIVSNLYTTCSMLNVKKQNQLVLAINVGEIDRFEVYVKNQ